MSGKLNYTSGKLNPTRGQTSAGTDLTGQNPYTVNIVTIKGITYTGEIMANYLKTYDSGGACVPPSFIMKE
jgi:hypothetical protein